MSTKPLDQTKRIEVHMPSPNPAEAQAKYVKPAENRQPGNRRWNRGASSDNCRSAHDIAKCG